MSDASVLPLFTPVEVGESLWLVEGPLVDFYGFAYPTRSVVAKLPDGELWVWSPIALNEQLTGAIDALGPVGHLVSPNRIHHLYLQDWLAVWPQASLWGPRSTVDKRTDLEFRAPLEHTPPPDWGDALDQAWFHGSAVMDEVVFFHRPSRTAILGDLSENFDAAFLRRHWRGWQRAVARFSKIVEGHGYAPLEWRLSWRRREPARAALGKVLDWDPERVIMAHGAWQPSHGRAYLERAFAWLQR